MARNDSARNMETDPEKQARTHSRIEKYLGELFDDPVHEEEDGHFYVRYGSTVLEVSVEPHGPDETAVVVMAYCAQDVGLEEELLLGLLELNHSIPFGGFSIVGSDVFFSYSILGHTLDRETLLSAITTVATISDEYDDRIVAKYGGQTALQKIQDTGGRRRRMER